MMNFSFVVSLKHLRLQQERFIQIFISNVHEPYTNQSKVREMAKIVLCFAMMSIVGLSASASVRENNITLSVPRPHNQLIYDNELSKIDAYRQRYYDLESEIWSELSKNDNEAQALRKIHNYHLAFYADQLENGVDLSLIETGEKDLLNEAKFINESVLTVTKKNLHKNERNFVKSQSIELASRHREFLRAMEAINNITKDNDFFGNIKKVNKLN